MPLEPREKLFGDEGDLPSRSARGNDRISAIYEAKSEGFGSDFLAALEETTRRIEQFPEAGPIDRANIRKRLVPGFPFTILYEIQSDRILIAAVMHQHRRPGFWRKRLQT